MKQSIPAQDGNPLIPLFKEPPTKWAVKRLKWSASGMYNGIWGDEPNGEDDVVCVRVADFDRVSNRVIDQPPTLRAVEEKFLENRKLEPGDLLIEKSGGGDNQLVGCVVSFDHQFDATCSNFVARIKPAIGVDSRYFVYLHAALYAARFNFPAIKQTTGIQNLDAEAYFNIKVAFPTEEEQDFIAGYLDRETAYIDTLIAEKERMLTLLEEKRAALISQAVTRGLDPGVPLKPSGLDWLGDIPAHWEIKRLKYLAQVRGGLTLGKKYSTSNLIEMPYLRVANVQDGHLNLEQVTTVEVPHSEAKGYLLKYGDVLMNEGGDIDKLGRGCVWRQEVSQCLHQNHVFAVRPFSVTSEWLSLWTSTFPAKHYFESRAKRATNLASISGTNIKELPVPMPPDEEQTRIQGFIEKSTNRITGLQLELRDTLRLLKERRSALITAAVTGQIDPEDMAA
ncbi:MAG: restriction endonuclease subunit S [Candidatus Sedimenticola sp. (ex Thyasira tokunagai)]